MLTTRSNALRTMATQPVVLVQGAASSGAPAWHFLRVEAARLPLLQREIKVPSAVDVSRYGEILASGEGSEPPPHILKRMKAVYGYKG